jgi:hypothetical protein
VAIQMAEEAVGGDPLAGRQLAQDIGL